MDEQLIYHGGEVKALGDGKVGGYLVRFTDADEVDLAGDYFDATTDFGIEPGSKTAVYLHHRQPLSTEDGKAISIRKQIGEGVLSQDDEGIIIEAILYERLQAQGVKVHDVHIPQGGGSLSVILQLEPAMEGQVTDALLAVLGSSWSNCKMAIAVDPDIDIYDYRDVHYALATRVDPTRHVITIPDARGFRFDPTARPILEASPDAGESRFPPGFLNTETTTTPKATPGSTPGTCHTT